MSDLDSVSATGEKWTGSETLEMRHVSVSKWVKVDWWLR